MRPLAKALLLPALLAVELLSCSEGTAPKAALTATIESGNTQTAQVGQTLPDSLVVIAKRGNTPAPGTILHYVIGSGDGSLSKTTDTTRADGTSHIAWTLPFTVHDSLGVRVYLLQQKDSVVDSTLVGTFVGRATPGPVHQVLLVSGSLQTGTPSTPMHDSLVVTVTDQYGNPLAGRHVAWTVANGGGSVTPSTSTTDVQGLAVAHGSYGPGYGANVIDATTDSVGTAAVFVNAAASNTPTTITATTTVGPSFPQTYASVSVAITSTYQISSVVGTLRGQSVAFTISGGNAGGTFSITYLQPGQSDTGSVSIVDVLGNIKTVAFTVTRAYGAPGITVTSPTSNSIVGTSANAQATCTTADPAGCTITVTRAGQTIGTAHGSINTTVPLSSYLDTWVPIVFAASDAAGQTVADTTFVLPSTSGHLATVVTTDGSAVLDYDGSRVLYRSVVSTGYADTAKIRSSGGTVTILASDQTFGNITYAGVLTSSGAVFQRGLIDHGASVYQYNGATTTLLGRQQDNYAFLSAGQYLLWGHSTMYSPPNISYWEILFTNLTTGISIDTLPQGTSEFDIAANGTVAYVSGSHYDLQASGPTLTGTLTHNDTKTRAFGPKTDGISILYGLRTTGISNNTVSLHLYTTTKDSIIASNDYPSSASDTFLSDYAINGGWIAYSLPSPIDASTRQLWIRSPQGTLSQASPLTGINQVVCLGNDGRIMFQNAGKLYLATSPYGAPTLIGNNLGRVVWRNGQFYEFVRGTVALIQ